MSFSKSDRARVEATKARKREEYMSGLLQTDNYLNSEQIVKVAKLKLGLSQDVETKEIEIKKLVPFENHSYEIKEDEINNLMESIKLIGLQTPITVRKKPKGLYEILAGHHRVEACKRLGIETIQANIYTNLSDEMAMAIVHQTNMVQRSFNELTIYEKAYSIYQMKEAKKELCKKNPSLLNKNAKTNESIGYEFGISRMMVDMFIALYTNLRKNDFELFDKKVFDILTAYTLCGIGQNSLIELIDFINENDIKKISREQAKKLKDRFQLNNELTKNDFTEILLNTEIKPKKVNFNVKKEFGEFFDNDFTESEIIEAIKDMLRKNN